MTDQPKTRDSLGARPLQLAPHVDNHAETVDNTVNQWCMKLSARGNKHWWINDPHANVDNPEDSNEDSSADC
jgi:hypothetical protein